MSQEHLSADKRVGGAATPPAAGTDPTELLNSVRTLRDASHRKREMLLQRATSRVRVEKQLHVASGLVAMLSGGAISSLMAATLDSLGIKIFAAAAAFSSALLSLVAAAFYDAKETEKMFEAAGRYGQLRDKLQTMIDSHDSVKTTQMIERLTTARAESGKLNLEFDRLITFSAEWSHGGNLAMIIGRG